MRRGRAKGEEGRKWPKRLACLAARLQTVGVARCTNNKHKDIPLLINYTLSGGGLEWVENIGGGIKERNNAVVWSALPVRK